MSKLPAAGEMFRFPYPFSRDTYEVVDADYDGVSVTTVPTWKVGPKNEYVYPDDTESVADAMGECVITVVSVHQPGRYPTRVFYTRTWVTPEGKAFGKTKLRVITASAFRGWTQGYRHEFTLRGCKCDGCRSWSDHRIGDSRTIAYESATPIGAVDPQAEATTDGPRA